MVMKVLPVEQIREVQDFLAARERLERVKEAYPEAVECLQVVAEEYNSTLVAADKAVRATGCSCGPFEVMSVAEKYDPQLLFDHLGEKDFLANGGSSKTIVVLDVDKNLVKAAIANGRIPEKVAARARKVSTRYKAPSAVAL